MLIIASSVFCLCKSNCWESSIQKSLNNHKPAIKHRKITRISHTSCYKCNSPEGASFPDLTAKQIRSKSYTFPITGENPGLCVFGHELWKCFSGIIGFIIIIACLFTDSGAEWGLMHHRSTGIKKNGGICTSMRKWESVEWGRKTCRDERLEYI